MFYSAPALSAVLPSALHAVPAVHELRAPGGTAAHVGFAVRILAALAPEAPVLWVSASPDWYPPGLAWTGIDPARCLFAQGKDDAACLGTLEVGLRGGMAGVAECSALTRLAAKRLALAAKTGGSLGFLLRSAPAFTREDSTAFASRWMISPAPGGMVRAELLYAKGGQPGVYLFETAMDQRGEEQNGVPSPALTVLRRAG
jgi:protein ImuA